MDEKEESSQESRYTNKKAAAYSFGQFPVITSFQGFTFLVFTFYFAVVGLNIILISIGFLIWSVWNGLNDPFLGALSDKTHTRWGRRFPWLMFSLIPIAIIMFLLFTPPLTFGITDQIANFIYFIIIIIIFELFFSMFDINLIAIFPEVFQTEHERTRANNIRQTFGIVGLITAFILPTLFIPDLSNRKYLVNYQIYGIVAALIIIFGGFIFLKFTPKEKAEFQYEYKLAPGFIKSMKLCVKNRSYRIFVPAAISTWYVYGMLPTIIPLYGKFVLGIGEGESIFLALLLGLAFISAALFMNLLWKPVVQRIGLRKTWFMSMTVWIVTLVPLLFISDVISGLIVFFLMGIGFSGSLYIYDLIIADIIDEDEVLVGFRREASYYGISLFFVRLATIFVFLSISLVFTNIGWTIFEPEKVTSDVIFGLRALMVIFPTIALIIAMIANYKYPLDGEYLKEVKEKLLKLHEEKISKI